ncbi:glucose-6-phosphate 1-epimerase isoform X1 [Dendroctonus ponderosae]|uniref:glucose-6-phosphate 1-epimerase n=1 Tax=Dendroctonus ponderosae TaxID=77166 RepID=U4U3V9_DENPD|nr:glucose-6-phosphate 1-epimerase isoform X1 [Dendroctonus ponderosae]ERL87013.1 hypothetical protein D910_04415 [Dendroctonus ponderosae]KAH1024563.1 hypothetical protein HUJ05_004025 [Dendroctonus ponderosae]
MSKVTKNIVVLDRGNYTTCSVHLHGGTILSYRVKNKEILYMRKKTAFNHFAPISGGIKFTFPYFGAQSYGPKHGFARYVPWNLEQGPTVRKDGNVEAVFTLVESEYTKAIWNYKFKISVRLTLCISELRVSVKVANTSKYFPFRFTILRHSIFKVEDVRKCEIYGLSGCKYVRLNENMTTTLDPEPDMEKLVIRRPYLDLFLETPSEIELRNIDAHGLKLRLKTTDATSTDVLICNPWEGNSLNSEDQNISADEYLHCLGVGNGHLSTDIRLEPMQMWQAHHIIEVVDDEYEKRIDELGRLLDNPLLLFKDTCKLTDVYSTSHK